MSKVTTPELVDKIIELLEDKRGFDDWWHGIDEYTQEEIKNDLYLLLTAREE